MGRTLAEKVWESHIVRRAEGEPDLLYIDLHLVHEVTSPQAFDGLRAAGRRVRRPDLTMATEDHNVPTVDIDKPIADPVSRTQVDTLRANCAEFGVPLYSLGTIDQGIVHVVGPELGITQPGLIITCGDSHTSTHGAFGAYAVGIGASQLKQILATQCLWQKKPKTLRVTVDGAAPAGVTAKDIVLAIIAKIGTAGGIGCAIEFAGDAIRALSMEGRLTVCNMAIEAGARSGMIAPDDKTYAYLQGREFAPQGAHWDLAVKFWRSLATDGDARFNREVTLDAATLAPMVTWGTSPEEAVSITTAVPDPASASDANKRQHME
ncbi:MAG: aconitase family protein, partial [Actinomycetes bacterium]